MKTPIKPTQGKTPKWKAILAVLGVVYIIVFAVWLLHALAKPSAPNGATELAAHPELQEEILAERKAQELQEQLSLSDEQTVKVADILYNYRQKPRIAPTGDPSERFVAMQLQIKSAEQTRSEIESVLSDEQRTAFAEMSLPGTPPMPRGGPPGLPPGGGPPGMGPPGGGPPGGGPPGGGPPGGGPEQFMSMSRQERREFLKERIRNGGPPEMPPGPPPGGSPDGQGGGTENTQ